MENAVFLRIIEMIMLVRSHLELSSYIITIRGIERSRAVDRDRTRRQGVFKDMMFYLLEV